MFQQYPQHENEPILLHKGRVRVRVHDRRVEASGSVHLRWLPSPGIDFDIETDEPVGLDPDSITVELPGFATKNVFAYSTDAPGLIRAYADEMEWGGNRRLLSVGFQIVNFSDFITPELSAVLGDPTATTNDIQTKRTVELQHDGWQIRLVAVPEYRDRYEHLRATGGYAFTHVGQLARIDASDFSVAQAKPVLESLRLFLTFARGAACCLPIQWGQASDGGIVWRLFGSPVVDQWAEAYRSWFDERHGGVLGELFDEFCRVRKDPRLREPLGVALHWYRHCNTQSSGLEGSLVLGMAALDLLGALIVVDRNGSISAGKYDALPGAKKLGRLLSALKVPADTPRRHEALTGFAREHGFLDAPAALVKMRNGFVHANEKHRRIVFGPSGKAAAFNAWQLSLWYQELALLYLLRHHGDYRNRTTAEWVGQVELVPWSRA